MSFKLITLSGSASQADQYHVLINSETCLENKIPHNAYIQLTNGNKSMISHVKESNSVAKGYVAIDRNTHALTLYAGSNDILVCCVYTDIPELTSALIVRLVRSQSDVEYPVFRESIYVAPGYTVSTTLGNGVVVSGTGLYKLDPARERKQLLGPQSGNRPSGASVREHQRVRAPRGAEIEEALVPTEPPTINIDFCQLGIGGLKEQMSQLIHQVLISRIIDKSMREKYAVKDIRGILLYGPPGTGKTLIARNIGKIIPNSIIKKVNGPELSSKFHGETESNIRGIFEEAKMKKDKLHVIIFDEIDAIGRKRGGGGGSSHIDDKVLTQLLTMIDGLDSANNILIIGITNRKDVLDDALVRAGRLECHIEIPLPTIMGRKEIIDIYLNPLREKNLVKDMNSDEWARRLDGYSGADIESLIGRAKNLALLRNCDIDNDTIKPHVGTTPLALISQDDMINALHGFQPTFSKNDNIVQRYITNYPLEAPDELILLKSEVDEVLSQPMNKPHVVTATTKERVLMCHLANSLDLPYVRYISYNEFLGKNSSENCNILNDAYINCMQAERAVLVLDSLGDVGDRALILRQRFISDNPLANNKQLIIINID